MLMTAPTETTIHAGTRRVGQTAMKSTTSAQR
ncbi:hypothetical protein QE377_001534 [Microbacterium sp. SORGH_AS 862]|nr:hypothetical protein [Microbacterium sp. SORGH_AS_0862]